MSDDLAAFVAARLDEDETEAKATADADAEFWADVRGDGTHFARHDPARVLRDVAAKRAILAEVVPAIEGMDMQIICEWGSSQDEPDAHLPLLKIMAAVYSDHMDYRPEWKP
jgi:hypothetical protein